MLVKPDTKATTKDARSRCLTQCVFASSLSEAATAPPQAEPESFDISTYKNYQHHSYNPYTFADLDLEMFKYRLPQPSSGRPSPRH